MKPIIYTLIIAALALSCSKQIAETTGSENYSGNHIMFNITDGMELKSSVESLSDLTASDAVVRVYATKDGGDLKKETTPATTPATYVYDYCNKQLSYNSGTGFWDVQGSGEASWEVDSTKAGCTYNFCAYAIRGSNIDTVVTTNFNSFGRSFGIELPSSYSDGCGTDFLLSNITSVTTTWNGSAARGNVVNLHMEHALASVRVKVKANKEIYKIGIQGIRIQNFYRKAVMVCTSQASYGSDKTNKWTMTVPEYNATNYYVGDVTRGSGNSRNTIAKCTGMIINKTDARERTIMDFIALPQDPSNAVLTIAYLVQELNGSSEHQVVSSWNLNEYDKWEYGYRNLYTITIDTSNSLESTVDDWDEGNKVTGVVLP